MMKRIFSLFGCGALICAAANLSTQSVNAADATDASDVPTYRPFTLGLEASSTGPGLAADWRFAEHFGARVGVNTFFFGSVDIGSRDIEGISYETSVRLLSEPLALDIYPWKSSTFRVTVGVLFNQNELEGVVPQSTVAGVFIPIGTAGNSYDSATIGDLNMQLEQNLVSPYVSIGMSFYLDKHKHWSLGGELGVAYTGSPDVTLTTGNPGTVNPADLASEAQQIEDGAWKFYPIVKISVNYSF